VSRGAISWQTEREIRPRPSRPLVSSVQLPTWMLNTVPQPGRCVATDQETARTGLKASCQRGSLKWILAGGRSPRASGRDQAAGADRLTHRGVLIGLFLIVVPLQMQPSSGTAGITSRPNTTRVADQAHAQPGSSAGRSRAGGLADLLHSREAEHVAPKRNHGQPMPSFWVITIQAV